MRPPVYRYMHNVPNNNIYYKSTRSSAGTTNVIFSADRLIDFSPPMIITSHRPPLRPAR